MSSIASHPCDDDMKNYVCSDGGYEHDDEGGYGVYENIHDHEPYLHESYYFGGEYEENDARNSYYEDGGVEEPCSDSYGDNGEYEGSHTTHYEDEDDLRYKCSSHLRYEPCNEDSHENESGDVDSGYSYALSCGTSYHSRSGVCGHVGTSRNIMSYASYPNANVSCSKYANGVGGRMEKSLSLESRENSMFQDWDDLKRRILEIKVSVYGDSGYVLLLDDHSCSNFIAPYVVER